MTAQTLLLRQVHPAFIQQGKVTSQVFRPTPKDQGKLSVYNGDKITPADAWEHFTAQPDCRSVGILAVSIAECAEAKLPVIEDTDPFPEHCSIYFSDFSKSQIDIKAKTLKAFAQKRGWLFQAC